MILIVLFLFIAVIVIALNMYNSSNLSTIEEYLKNQSCENIVYSSGSYKSLCNDRILEISNSFQVDIQKNSKLFYYKDIDSIDVDVKKHELIINDENKIRFKSKDEVYKFYDDLVKKVKN